MKYAIVKSYGKKGEKVINMNYAAVDRGGEYTKVDVPAEWANLMDDDAVIGVDVPDFIKNIVMQKGVVGNVVKNHVPIKIDFHKNIL